MPVLAAFVVYLETVASHERIFLANLGFSRNAILAVAFGTALVAEAALCLAREGLMYLPGREFLSRRRTLAWHHRMLAIQMGMKAEEVLGDDPMKVSEFRHRERNLISGGERRRGEMSLVLARKPRCLLADEPLAGIGPKDQEEVAEALRRLADGGCAILVTGHDVNPLMALADDII